MSPRALAAGLTTGSLLAAMVTGAVLMTPSFAKEEKGHAPRGKREKEIRVIRHHGPSHELSADEMRERVDELQDSLGDHEERLEEARRLLDKAGDALRDGDESVARALLMEAERLLHHGPPMHDFLMMAPPAPGMPPMPPMAHGMVQGPGEKRLLIKSEIEELEIERDGDQVRIRGFKDGKDFDVRGTREEVQRELKELGIDSEIIGGDETAMFYNFGGPGHAMAFGGPGEAEGFIELELTVEDGTATAKGKTKDGKPFNLKGTVDEVNRELKELGITVEALKDAGDEMHIKLKGGPHGHAFAFTPPGGHGKAFFGHELTDEERAEIEREVARITDEADRLFEQGKTDEAMKKLHELHKYAMRLHGGPGSMAFGAPHGAMVFPGHDEREVRVIIGEALQDLDLEHLGPEVRAEIEAAVEDLDLENLGEEIRIELEEALGDIDVDVTEIQKEIDRAIAEVEKSRQYYRWGKDKDRAQADKQKATREADRAKERGGDAQAKDRKSDRKSGTDDQYNPGRRRDSDDRRRDEERKRLPDA